MNSSSFVETGSTRDAGTLLPGNAVAVKDALEPVRVAGSKIWGNPEKFPARIAGEGTLRTVWLCFRLRSDSKFDVKNSRFLPLKILGIHTGPPRVNPYWLNRNGSLTGTTLVNA